MGRLDGRTALITGGTSGLGLAIAERFLGDGAAVVVTGRDASLGAETEAHLRELGRGSFVRADAADPAAVSASVAVAVDRLGGLDVLVNNAGVSVSARALDTPVGDVDRVLAVNLRGYLLYAQAAYPHLAQRRGCMIHISSDAGVTGEQAIGVYSVSKAAEIMLSKMLALDGGPDGVRSNCICPGDIVPGMRHVTSPGRDVPRDEPSTWTVPPIGRLGEAPDVASAALYLASDDAAFVTGTTLVVDGGRLAKL